MFTLRMRTKGGRVEKKNKNKKPPRPGNEHRNLHFPFLNPKGFVSIQQLTLDCFPGKQRR